jgi:hypothetical protein
VPSGAVRAIRFRMPDGRLVEVRVVCVADSAPADRDAGQLRSRGGRELRIAGPTNCNLET